MKNSVAISMAGLIMLISACTQNSVSASKKFDESIRYFSNDRTESAFRAARELGSYNEGASKFLLTQYSVYAMMRSSVTEDRENFNNFSKINLNDPKVYLDNKKISAYRDEYIVAKVFSELQIRGVMSAKKMLAKECDSWRSRNSLLCIRYILVADADLDLVTGNHFYQISLYELADIISESHGLGLADDATSDLWRAIALRFANPKRASDIISRLNDKKLIDSRRIKFLCRYFSQTKVNFSDTGILCPFASNQKTH